MLHKPVFSSTSCFMRSLLASAAIAVGLIGCGRTMEHTSVTVVYLSDSNPDPIPRYRFSEPGKKQVEAAFQSFSTKHGYRCRRHIKRVDEITCQGPKDLHLTFVPSLNRLEFVANFSWLGSSDRTHEEFVRQVAEFKKNLGAVVGSDNIRESRTG